jgi:tetratricopeptide (TPR) repeat protein
LTELDPVSLINASGSAIKKLGVIPTISGVLGFGLLLVLGQNCSKAMAYKTHLDSGLVALSSGDPNRAQAEFGVALTSEPNSAEAYYYLAQAEAERGSNGNAITDFSKAIALRPDSAKFYQARAALHMKMHNFDAAVADCKLAIKADKTFIDTYRISASAQNHLLRFDKAIEDATKFLGAYSIADMYRADALAKRAFAQDQLKHYTESIDDYTNALACDPDNGSLYASRAVVYMHAEDWQKGVSDCNRALTFKQNDAAVFKVRGICLAALNKHTDSMKDLNKLVTLHPTVDTHRVRGSQRLLEHDYLGTLEDFDYVLRAEPDDQHTSKAYLKAKTALQRFAKKTAVIADAEPRAKMPSRSDLNRTQPELASKGNRLFLAGDMEPAIAYLVAALRINANDVASRRSLAHACVQTARYSSAVKQYALLESVVGLSRTDAMLYAKAELEQGQPNKAVELYSELVASNPADDLARTSLVKTLISIGSSDEAARIAAEGAHVAPKNYRKYNDLFHQAVASKTRKAKLI